MMSLEYRKLTKQDLDTFINKRINQLREGGCSNKNENNSINGRYKWDVKCKSRAWT